MVFSQRSLRQSQTIIQLNTLFRWPQINLFEYFGFQTIENFLIIYKKSEKIEKKSLIIFIANFKFFKSSRKKSSFFDAQICSFIRIIWTFMPKNVSFSKPKNAPILKIISIFTKKIIFG